MSLTHAARLRPFALLWSAATVSSLGDGVHWIALPLLAAELTTDPRMITTVTVAEQLPWLLFGLLAGVLADRLDRRRTMWTVDVVRAGIVAAFALAVLTDAVGLPMLLGLAFVLTSLEALHGTAATAYLPTLVPADRLPAANGRLQAGAMVTDTLIGSPLGAVLFGAAAVAPFALDAVTFAVAAVLIAAIPVARRRRAAAPRTAGTASPAGTAPALPTTPATGPAPAGGADRGANTAAPRPAPAPPSVMASVTVPPSDTVPAPAARPAGGPPGTAATAARALRAEMGDGIRFLARHRLLRALCVYTALINLVTMVAVALMVLYTRQLLHLGTLGYGLLIGTFAVGGAAGALLADRAAVAFGARRTLLGALALAVLSVAGISLAPAAVPAGVAVAGFGAATGVWQVVAVSTRQALVPARLLGRVTSVYRIAVLGCGPLGAAAAGVVAHRYGLRAPLELSAGLLLVSAVLAPLLLVPGDFAAARRAGRAREDAPTADGPRPAPDRPADAGPA